MTNNATNIAAPDADQRPAEVRRGLLAAGLLGALAILCGAWAAHGLEAWLLERGLDPQTARERVEQFDVGARYHLIHAVVLLSLVAVGGQLAATPRRWIARLMLTGTVLFSGSLYLLVLTNTPWLGAVTPVGGLCWVVAWSWLAVAPVVGRRGIGL